MTNCFLKNDSQLIMTDQTQHRILLVNNPKQNLQIYYVLPGDLFAYPLH